LFVDLAFVVLWLQLLFFMLYVFEHAAWSWLRFGCGGCSSLRGTACPELVSGKQSAVVILSFVLFFSICHFLCLDAKKSNQRKIKKGTITARSFLCSLV
jgi:hypothetical protein